MTKLINKNRQIFHICRSFCAKCACCGVGDSSFSAQLEASSAEDRFIQFWVWPDSFEAYLEARYLAEASGFDVAWSPVEGRNPVGVQLLGPRRNRVMID